MYTGFLFCEYNAYFQLLNKAFWSFHKIRKFTEAHRSYTQDNPFLFLNLNSKFIQYLSQVGKKCLFYNKKLR